MKHAIDPEFLALLDEIREEVRSTRHLTGRSTLAPRVLDAFRQVPRQAFVPDGLQWAAHQNRPLPIGHSQTISQPFIVALMSDLLDPQADDVILEIGTGSGYQAAVLSRLVKQVYSLEIIEELARNARRRLQGLGYANVTVGIGDGNLGWAEHAPYDGIIVTAAATRVPAALLEQLKPGGKLVIPVGDRFWGQDLRVIRKDESGHIEDRSVLPVIFVPLTGRTDLPEPEAPR
ncbi:protein-L-isoaspartate O-methyltransferase [Rhodocyclus purpureus]|nr:protein-L-isoaspartate O-methyltransferase [Rhodocyclus purpureus]